MRASTSFCWPPSHDCCYAEHDISFLSVLILLDRYADDLEHELLGELENARLVRLMSKLGFINERPQ